MDYGSNDGGACDGGAKSLLDLRCGMLWVAPDYTPKACRHRADLPVTAGGGLLWLLTVYCQPANYPRVRAAKFGLFPSAQVPPCPLFLLRLCLRPVRSPGPREDGYESRSVDRVPPARTQHELSHRQNETRQLHPYSALPRTNATDQRVSSLPPTNVHCLRPDYLTTQPAQPAYPSFSAERFRVLGKRDHGDGALCRAGRCSSTDGQRPVAPTPAPTLVDDGRQELAVPFRWMSETSYVALTRFPRGMYISVLQKLGVTGGERSRIYKVRPPLLDECGLEDIIIAIITTIFLNINHSLRHQTTQ